MWKAAKPSGRVAHLCLRLDRDPNQIVCNYDESEAAAAPKRRRGAGGQARLKELQDRIGEYRFRISSTML